MRSLQAFAVYSLTTAFVLLLVVEAVGSFCGQDYQVPTAFYGVITAMIAGLLGAAAFGKNSNGKEK
jgi:hypothetical protein